MLAITGVNKVPRNPDFLKLEGVTEDFHGNLVIDGHVLGHFSYIQPDPNDPANYTEPYFGLFDPAGKYLGYKAPTAKALYEVLEAKSDEELQEFCTSTLRNYYLETASFIIVVDIDAHRRFRFLATNGDLWYAASTNFSTFSRKRLSELLTDKSFINYMKSRSDSIKVYDLGTMKPAETLSLLLRDTVQAGDKFLDSSGDSNESA